MNDTGPIPARSTRRGPARSRVVTWLLFFLTVGLAASGLGGYRIENSLHHWAPKLAGHDLTQTYVVIGGEKEWLDTAALAEALGSIPEVLLCIRPDGPGVPLFGLYRAPRGPGRNGAVFDDPGYTGLFCFARADADSALFLDAVKRVIVRELGEHGDQVALGGPAVFASALDDWSQRRLPFLSVLIVVVGAVFLKYVGGSIKVALSATAAIVGSQIVLVGIISWLGVPMDMVMSMVSPLMMALGFSFAAHRALRPSVSGTLALCAATTAAGILGFVFTDFPPVRSFAAWGAIGLMLTWGCVMLLVGQARLPSRRGRGQRRLSRFLLRTVYVCAFGKPRIVVFTALLLTLLAGVCLPRLQLRRDPIGYFPENARVSRDYRELDRRLIGMLPFEVAVTGDAGAIGRAGADAGEMLSRTPGVRLVVDISPIDPSHTKLYVGFADGDGLDDLVAAQGDWRRWADERNLSLQWAGVAAQLHAVAAGLVRVSATAFPAMVLMAAAIVWLIGGRDIRLAMIGAWVNLLPIVVLIPAVYLAGVPLSLPSLMIGAIAVGTAIDDTLHLVVGLSKGHSIRRVWLRCLRPCAGSSLVAAACMAMFVLSPFRPTAEFGALMAVAIIAALAGDMVLFPAVLTLTQPDARELRSS